MPLPTGYSRVPLSRQDAPALQHLYEQCTEYMMLVTGAAADPTEAEDLLRMLPPGTTEEQKLVLGLRAPSGELHGAVELTREFPREDTWHIGEFILTPEMRGRGLGRKLYRAVEAQARGAGARRIELAVHEANAGALAFWSRMGFEETGRAKLRLKALESTFVVMRKLLPPPPDDRVAGGGRPGTVSPRG